MKHKKNTNYYIIMEDISHNATMEIDSKFYARKIFRKALKEYKRNGEKLKITLEKRIKKNNIITTTEKTKWVNI